MRERLVKYSLVVGLALLLAAPAVAYSQRIAPQAPGAGQGPGPGMGPGPGGGMGPGFGPGPGPGGQPGIAPGFGQGRGPQPGMAPRGQRGRMDVDRVRGPRGRMGGGGLAARALAHADEIGLSAEQRDQILAAQRALQEEQINRRAATQIDELALRDLMAAENRDLAAIEGKLRELSEQRIAGQMAMLRFDETVTGLLSAEQRATLDELAPARRRAQDRPARRDADRRGPRRNAR
jgi:Spy/CpxP family protein refolding chaperone